PSSECRPSAGSASFTSASGATKSGMTKSSRWRRVSRTSPGSPGVRRRRRSRVAGKLLTERRLRLRLRAELAVAPRAIDPRGVRVAAVLQHGRDDHAQARRSDPHAEVAADDLPGFVRDRVDVDPDRRAGETAERDRLADLGAEPAVDVPRGLRDPLALGA